MICALSCRLIFTWQLKRDCRWRANYFQTDRRRASRSASLPSYSHAPRVAGIASGIVSEHVRAMHFLAGTCRCTAASLSLSLLSIRRTRAAVTRPREYTHSTRSRARSRHFPGTFNLSVAYRRARIQRAFAIKISTIFLTRARARAHHAESSPRNHRLLSAANDRSSSRANLSTRADNRFG